jgi:alkyl hydroperoxide reductase subunit AhpC
LKAWADSLGGIHYPLLSDFWPHGEVAQEYGVLRADGNTERAL